METNGQTSNAQVERSADIAELAKGLAAAQGEIETASKDRVNPHFGSAYATLASVWDACRQPLTKAGLSIVQQPVSDGARVGVVTTLLHASGQWMRSTLWATPERPAPQAIGSCLTYLRRYSLAAFVGVAPDDDDDGEGAEGRGKPPARAAKAPPKAEPKPADPPPERASAEALNEIVDMLKRLGWARPHISSWLQKHAGVPNVGAIAAGKVVEIRGLLTDALDKMESAAAAAEQRQ